MIASLLIGLAIASPTVDVKVDGAGYLRFVREGRAVYAKEAKLTEKNGKLCNASGDPVLPTISLAANLERIEVDLEGNVSVTKGGSKASAGRLVLAIFGSSAMLSQEKGVLVSSERPKVGNPGEDTNGVIRMGGVVNTSSAPPKANVPTTSPKPTNNVKTDGSVNIILRGESEVAGDKILLGEIADISADDSIAGRLSEVDLGETPAFGVTRNIDRLRVIGRLKAAGFKPEEFNVVVPSKVAVRRQAQIIKHQQFVDVVLQRLASESPSGEYESKDILPDFSAPMGELLLQVENVNGLTTQNISATVAIYVDSKRITSRTVRLRAKVEPVMIKSGMAVNVIFKTGGVQLQLPGTAKSAGSLNGTVQVEVKAGTSDTKSVHVGVVVGPGLVEVRL